MTKIDSLLMNYTRHINIPWRPAAPDQRVIFCVYSPHEERRLRLKIREFELNTCEAGNEWADFDLTERFAEWLSGQRYAERYYQQPQLIRSILPHFPEYITKEFQQKLECKLENSNCVIALLGTGSLFGLVKVKEVVDKLAPLVKGRLVVFFPGTYEQNNYRLLDGYDGWNYLAVPITATSDF